MIFSAMKTFTLDLVFGANYDRFSETFVESAINKGCIDFLDKTEAIDTHWTQSTEEDQLWYLCPTNSFELTRIEWYDASETKRHTLVKKTMEEMDEEYPYAVDYDADTSWQSVTGDPKVWIPKEHDVYGIWPACDIDNDTLYLHGRKKHVDMDEDGDEPGFADQWHIIPCIYAARMLLRSDNDEKAASFEKWYKEEVFMAKRTIMDRKKMMPAKWRSYTY